MNYRIGIIGAGNMGGTFYRRLSKHFPKEALFICDRDEQKFIDLEAVNFTTEPKELVNDTGVIILAVKPQTFDDLMGQLGDALKEKLVISIMAGVTLEKLKEKTGSGRLVRSMPNLPAQAGQSVTVWMATEEVTVDEKERVSQIFSAIGTAFEVGDELKIDKATTISGCGPAYFFYLTELLSKKAEALGFSEEEARKMAENTFVGSAALLSQGDKSAREWKEAVTSKGGATEAALTHLKGSDFERIFSDAIEAAHKRCAELNNQ